VKRAIVASWVAVAVTVTAISMFAGVEAGEIRFDVVDRGKTIGTLVFTDIAGHVVTAPATNDGVVLLNFWASWCAPCALELPDLITLQAEFEDRLMIIGIAVEEPDSVRLQEFVSRRQINYPVVMATPEIFELLPDVEVLPTSFILDGDGRLRGRIIGRVNPSTLKRWLAASGSDR
jgi:thiol-disulfide isomerase/thioredoxin